MFLFAAIGAVVGGVIGGIISSANGGDFWTGAAVGAAAGGLIGLTCGAAASYVATVGAITGPTIFASTATVSAYFFGGSAAAATVAMAEATAGTIPTIQNLFQLGQKTVEYFTGRGWSADLINNTMKNPVMTGETINATTGNPATAYFLSGNQYVIIDSVTKQLVQVSNLNDLNWIVDSRIIFK